MSIIGFSADSPVADLRQSHNATRTSIETTAQTNTAAQASPPNGTKMSDIVA